MPRRLKASVSGHLPWFEPSPQTSFNRFRGWHEDEGWSDLTRNITNRACYCGISDGNYALKSRLSSNVSTVADGSITIGAPVQ